MRYGRPCYEKNNVIEAGFASQKHFIGLYILKMDVMEQYRGELKGISVGKGCIRYTKPQKIVFAIAQKLLAGTSVSPIPFADTMYLRIPLTLPRYYNSVEKSI